MVVSIDSKGYKLLRLKPYLAITSQFSLSKSRKEIHKQKENTDMAAKLITLFQELRPNRCTRMRSE